MVKYGYGGVKVLILLGSLVVFLGQVQCDVDDEELTNLETAHTLKTFSETKDTGAEEVHPVDHVVEGSLIDDLKLKNKDVVTKDVLEKEEPGKTDDELIDELMSGVDDPSLDEGTTDAPDEVLPSEEAPKKQVKQKKIPDLLDDGPLNADEADDLLTEEELLDGEEIDDEEEEEERDEELVLELPEEMEEDELELNGMPEAEAAPEETMNPDVFANLQPDKPTYPNTPNSFEEIGDVPAPKLPDEELPGDSELHQAEEILGLRESKEKKGTLEMLLPKPNYRKAYALLQSATVQGNNKARVLLGMAHLTGEHVPYVSHNTSLALELFEEAAKSGLPSAQQMLGAMYSTGLETNSSQSKALLYYTFAALGGDALAQMALAFRYWSGISVAQSCESALKYYTLVADGVARKVGSTGAGQGVLRIRLMEEEQSPQNSPILDEDLVQYYQFLADKGDLQAQLGLGQLYLQGGRGIDRNIKLAQHYFNAAAKSGNTNAYGYLGKISMGLKEYEIALKYFKLATKDPQGQWGMGTLYYNGWGINQDYKQALSYFTAAAQQGHTEAELQLGVMSLSGIGTKKDFGTALKHFNIASKSGHVLAFYNLGMMHSEGIGVMRNCQTAAELLKNVAERGVWGNNLMDAHALYHKGFVDSALIKYLLLAEQGYEVAQTNAAFILDREETDFIQTLKYRFKRAFVNWKRAATQGFGGARLKLGDYYYYGQGTQADPVEAAEQYQLASDVDHNPQAMFNLGYMHELGIGRQQDMHLAKRYYDLAASTSLDAHVPALLANTKLQAKIHAEWLLQCYKDFTFTKLYDGIVHRIATIISTVTDTFNSIGEFLLELDNTATEEWDIYLMSILAIILGLVMAVRGHNVRNNIRADQMRQQEQQNRAAEQQNQEPAPVN